MTFDPPPPPPPPSGDGDQPGQPFGQQPGDYQPGGAPGYPGAPQYPGNQPMGASGHYSGVYPQNYPNGTTILVLGILGLVVCGPLGIVAWVMGNKAMKEIDASGQVYENRGIVQAGRILGIIATVFIIIGVAFLIFAIASGGFFAFMNASTL